MAGNLIIPRVEVFWGDTILTAPNGDFGPLVYDVRVSLEDQGQTPTGSMKWNPTAVGLAEYERLLDKYPDWSIMVTFHYLGGNSITFEFYWGGQSDTYGKEMDVTVKLISLLDGLVNANFFATVQTSRDEKGISFINAITETEKQFGISGLGLNMIRYTPRAFEDLSNAQVKASYNDGATFADALQNLVKDNGNNVFFNNIGKANAVIYTPYSWEGADNSVNLVEFREGVYPGVNPDPTKRYGYFIGPHIIQSITRTNEWQPPQKSQEINAAYARKAYELKQAKKAQNEARKRNKRRAAPQGQTNSRTSATAGSGIYGSKNSYNIYSAGNENGPVKQDLFTKERAAKLSMSTLMCPSLVGIKPLDLIFVVNYSNTYIEDWVVSSVEYQQTGSGGVDVSIQATRTHGDGDPMYLAASEGWQKIAQKVLFGEGESQLNSWAAYAWGNYSDKYGGQTFASPPSVPTYQSVKDGEIILKGSGLKITKSALDYFVKSGLTKEQLDSFTREQIEREAAIFKEQLPFPNEPFNQAVTISPDEKSATIKNVLFYQYLKLGFQFEKVVQFFDATKSVKGLSRYQLETDYNLLRKNYEGIVITNSILYLGQRPAQ